MSEIPTMKVVKGREIATINVADLPAWQANGWKPEAPAESEMPEGPEEQTEPEAPAGSKKRK